jgi:hypothetical protein
MYASASCKPTSCKVIDFAACRRREKERLRKERLYFCLAIVPQYLSLASLLLYALLRLLLAGSVPFSYYMGPLTLLWPASFFFLLTSYIADILLWED